MGESSSLLVQDFVHQQYVSFQGGRGLLDFIQRFGELESFFGNGSHVTSQGPHQRASKLGGGNWGTLRIPSEDLGTLGNIRND